MASKLKGELGETVLYLYGITQTAPDRVPRILGVDGTGHVEPIVFAGLMCWISRVAAKEFADDLARNMENLDWLSEKSVAHQSAVTAISKFADILPARFGTVFLSEDSLEADVKKRKREIKLDFERIAGSDEWGVKVFVLPPKPASTVSRKVSGRDYLQAKSQVLRSKAPPKADEEVDRFATALQKVASDSAPAGKISGGRRDLVYQVSLLVKRAHRKQFEALLRQFSSQWKNEKAIECTGPWPVYSFVSRKSN